jgi:hypothetical protein
MVRDREQSQPLTIAIWVLRRCCCSRRLDAVRIRLPTVATNGAYCSSSKMMSHDGIILTREDGRTRRRTCPSATLSTVNPTQIDLVAKPVGGRRLTAWAMVRSLGSMTDSFLKWQTFWTLSIVYLDKIQATFRKLASSPSSGKKDTYSVGPNTQS